MVLDWEAAIPEAPPLYDLFHYLVQAHLHLGRPSFAELVDGVRSGEGWIGRVVEAYCREAGIDVTDVFPLFRRYLSASCQFLARQVPPPAGDIEGRGWLLREAGG
jgi:hypothetical protein